MHRGGNVQRDRVYVAKLVVRDEAIVESLRVLLGPPGLFSKWPHAASSDRRAWIAGASQLVLENFLRTISAIRAVACSRRHREPTQNQP
jgi:hypothetical protein